MVFGENTFVFGELKSDSILKTEDKGFACFGEIINVFGELKNTEFQHDKVAFV